ncbi:MAG: glutamate--cysteine ligase, partial [Polaromonas sp.]
RGREPGVKLKREGGEVALVQWGAEVLAECAPIAAALDAAHGGMQYRDALAAAGVGLADAATLPSARVLEAMAQDFDHSFVKFVRAQSLKTRDLLQGLPLSQEQLARFTALSQQSVDAQKKIEAADRVPFEEYRQQYVSAECLEVPVREVVHG